MRSRASFLLLGLLIYAFGLSAGARGQSWTTLNSGGDTNLRAISAIKIATTGHIAIWASGSHDVILRSLDDGATWSHLSIPGHPNVFVVGDLASLEQDGKPVPGVAPAAIEKVNPEQ